ncbi:MAG: HAMP domain-containing histidine kinase [Myxococcales bacterium]|nr:HAMP domain-containing histidine kinase [Myxococcales bacterium]
MARGFPSDPSTAITAGLGSSLLAIILASYSLFLGTDRELTATIVLGTTSLACVISPALGLRPHLSSHGLLWTWTLGGPILLSLTPHRPLIALAGVGPLLALILVGRRVAIAATTVSFGLCALLVLIRISTRLETSGAIFQNQAEMAMGLLLVGALVGLGLSAASSQFERFTKARSTAINHARWLNAIRDTMLQVDARGLVQDARWSHPFAPPQHWRGAHLGDVIPEIRGLIGPLLAGAHRGEERLHVRLERGLNIDAEIRAMVGFRDTVVLLLRDVTREREAERLDREVESQRTQGASQTQLLQDGRLAHMGVIAFGIAHEINNPLAYVMSNLQYVADGLDHDEPVENLKEAIHDAVDGARRIRSIVEDVQMFAKADDSDHLELLQLSEVALSAVRLLRFELRQRVRLVEEHHEAPSVFANPSRLAQGILNLLVNAVQAIPKDRHGSGSIILRTGTTITGEAFIEVTDDGVGIPEENRRRVFEPFFTTRPVGQGTGLGLSICYGLVHRLGGKVDVESAVGAGSTFRIRLPNGQKLLDA